MTAKFVIRIVMLFGLAQSAYAANPLKQVAITFDDLPGWRPVADKVAEATLGSLAKILNYEKVPATGFIIGGLATRNQDARKALDSWAQAGLPLANHTWNHRRYSELSVKDFLVEIEATEKVLRPFQEKYGWPRAFRFPMLNQGRSLEHERAANRYFQKTQTLLGYVSIDNSDWAFAEHYDEATKKQDSEKIKKIEELYIRHIFDCVDYAERASEAVFSRQIPQILLLHANSLNVTKLRSIILGLRERGYKFISFAEAMTDPAYKPFKYKIAYQRGGHFFEQVARLRKQKLPEGPDPTYYRYFVSHWEPRLK